MLRQNFRMVQGYYWLESADTTPTAENPDMMRLVNTINVPSGLIYTWFTAFTIGAPNVPNSDPQISLTRSKVCNLINPPTVRLPALYATVKVSAPSQYAPAVGAFITPTICRCGLFTRSSIVHVAP